MPSHHEVLHFQWQIRWAVMKEGWKLIGKRDEPEYLASLERKDPEKENLIESEPEIVQELHELHDSWLESVS